MLGVEFTDAECSVRVNWTSHGSVFAGTIGSTCHSVEISLMISSDAPQERVAALIRSAEGGCYAQSALQKEVPVFGTALLNGEDFDYNKFPRKVPRK